MQLKTFLSKLKERKKHDLVTNACNVSLMSNDCMVSAIIVTLLHVMVLFFCVLYFIDAQLLIWFSDWMSLLYIVGIAVTIICDRKIKKIDFLYLILLSLFYFSTILYTNGGLGSVISIILPLVFICCVESCNINKVITTVLVVANILILCAFTIIVTFFATDYNFYITTFKHLNPNTISMISLMVLIMWFIFADYEKSKKGISLLVVLIVDVVYIVSKTKGRTSLLGLVLICLLILSPKKIFTKVFAKKWTASVMVVFGLVIPIVYLHLYNLELNLVFGGESLYTGREEVWRNLFTQLSDGGVLNWLFGVGSDAEILGNSFDAHNSYYSVIGCFGVVGFLLYGLFFMKKIELLYDFTNDAVVRKSIIALYAILILSYFEAINLISLGMFSFFLPIGLGLSRARELNSKKNMCADISIVSL